VKLPKEKIDELAEVTGRSGACGWMFDEVAAFLHAFVLMVQPHVVIQTGHLWGKSACAILDALRDTHFCNAVQGDAQFEAFVQGRMLKRKVPGKLISVDPGPLGVPKSDEGIEYLTKTYPGQFEFYKMPSNLFFQEHRARLKDELHGQRILGVVDGDHTTYGCHSDLAALADIGAQAFFVDDTEWLPELHIVCQDFAREHSFQFLNLPYLNGVGLLVSPMVMARKI
jgi:hypothetical protein